MKQFFSAPIVMHSNSIETYSGSDATICIGNIVNYLFRIISFSKYVVPYSTIRISCKIVFE